MRRLMAAAALTLVALGCSDSREQRVKNAAVASTLNVPVYSVKSTGLTDAQLVQVKTALAPYLPREVTLARSTTGVVSMLNPAALRGGTVPVVSQAPGASKDDEPVAPAGTATYAWSVDALAKIAPLSDAAATELLTAATRGFSFGDTGVVVRTSPMTLELYNPSTKQTTFKGRVGSTSVRTSRLGNYPLIGPGAAMKIVAGSSGQLASATFSARTYAQSGTTTVVAGADATQRCATASAGAATFSYAATLVYYAPPLSEQVTRVDPVLQCTATSSTGETLLRYLVNARVDLSAARVVAGLPRLPEILLDGAKLEVGSAFMMTKARPAVSNTGPNTTAWRDAWTAFGALQPVKYSESNPNAAYLASDSVAGVGVDSVDLWWYNGHSAPYGPQGDVDWVPVTDMRLGDTDLEWFASHSCSLLADGSGSYTWQARLTPMFQGLHLLMGFATTAWDVPTMGSTFAANVISTKSASGGMAMSWIGAAVSSQDDTTWAVMGVQNSSVSTMTDCLKCGLPDIPASDASRTVWRLTGAA